MERRFTAAHVVKHLDCNWKVTIEAFIETFHVIGLHPESLPFFGDVNSQYDVWSGKRHMSRMINPSGVSSPHLAGKITPERAVAGAARFGLCADGPLQPGETLRSRIVARLRGLYGETFGADPSVGSVAEPYGKQCGTAEVAAAPMPMRRPTAATRTKRVDMGSAASRAYPCHRLRW